MQIILASRLLTVWMVCIGTLMGVLISREKSSDNTFYRFGPHSDFIVLGIHIDTFDKYLLVLLYCACNTAMRNIRNDIILPWVTLTVFDTSPEAMDRKLSLSHKMAYEISNVSAIYGWFDWFIYINLLLSQVDMVLIEIGMDIVATSLITYMYLNPAI
jgi:hypothetical protein